MMMGGDQEKNDPAASASAGSVTGVPAEYQAAVLRAGLMCPEVPAPIIAAQIEAESAWDPNATSEAGAQGLTQFMPGTWAQYGIDGDGDGAADVWNPQDAIASQGAYMCALVGIVKGYLDQGLVSGDATDLALAAYNAGPGAIRAAGGIPVNGQTEIYVPRIKEAAAGYAVQPGGAGPGGGPVAQAAVDAARGYLGVPYVWAGESAAGMDCSGLTVLAYRAAGVTLTHSARAQYGEGTQVPLDQAQSGDLVFWSTDGTQEGIYHVALYLGADTIIEAPTYGLTVRETPMRPAGAMPNAIRPY